MQTLSAFFKWATILAMTAWLPMIFSPNERFTEQYVIGVAAALLAILYGYLLIFGKKYDEGVKYTGSFKDLEGVINLFKSPRSVLIGWIHYLAFDAIIGLFMLKNSQHYGINHWLMIPCLFATFMFGPLGLLLYLLLRFAVTHDYLAAYFFT
jgi:Domain of unknown function (DUF4281)